MKEELIKLTDDLEVKEWAELSTREVENIFSLRSEVFVVNKTVFIKT